MMESPVLDTKSPVRNEARKRSMRTKHVHEDFFVVRAEFRTAFESLGWRSVTDILESSLPTVMRQVGSRDNCWIELDVDNKQDSIRCFLKRHRESHFWKSLAAKVTGRHFRSAGQSEADGVAACRVANVPAMELVAAGWRKSQRIGQCESFFMSEQVPGDPADHFWSQWCATANLESTSLRNRVLQALAVTAKRFHEAGLRHRDFYWCHFFVEAQGEEMIARLIDLQRVLQNPIFSARWRLKDLGQFVFSMPTDLTAKERRYWFSCYLGRETWTWSDRFCWLAVRVRAWFYGIRESLR